MSTPYAAVVLTGGRGSRLAARLDGRSKPEIVVAGSRILDRVLAAVARADPLIVVGPDIALPPQVARVQEAPPGGGPVAGLAAALPLLVGHDIAVVLAGDLPFLRPAHVEALIAGCTTDGCVLVDETGRDQLLAGAWRIPALVAAVRRLPAPAGASWRGLVAGLHIARCTLNWPPGAPAPWWDCDTVEDLDRAEEWL